MMRSSRLLTGFVAIIGLAASAGAAGAAPIKHHHPLQRHSGYAIDSRPPAYRTFNLSPDGSISTQVHWVEALPMRQTATAR